MTTKPATLTPDLSKQARRELGLSQNDVIKTTGIQAYKLKQWEGRGLTIELADIRKLSDFYESQGVSIAELIEHHASKSGAAREGSADQAPEARPALQAGFTYNPRPGFVISDQLPLEVVDSLMVRMEANDDRIAGLIGEAFTTSGFFGTISDDTEAKARELVACLAENHVIFRALQGRNIVSMSRDEPKTIGEYLGKMLEASPILPMIAAEAKDAAPKRTGKAKAGHVLSEMEG